MRAYWAIGTAVFRIAFGIGGEILKNLTNYWRPGKIDMGYFIMTMGILCLVLSLYQRYTDYDAKKVRLEISELYRRIEEQNIENNIKKRLFDLEVMIKDSMIDNPYVYVEYSDWIVSLSSKMDKISGEVKRLIDNDHNKSKTNLKNQSLLMAAALIRFHLSIDLMNEPSAMLRDQRYDRV